MGKREHIVRYTVEELREMCERGESKSDWEQAAAMMEFPTRRQKNNAQQRSHSPH